MGSPTVCCAFLSLRCCASQVPLVASGKLRQIKVWEFDGTAYDQGDIAAEWVSNYLGDGAHRLVRYAGEDVQ